MLNYLYALGEAEARLAFPAVGLEPGLGFSHVDQRSRDSAALDVLEVIRPDIDRYVYALLRDRRRSRRDFAELREGTCRILAPLTHELAETLPAWTKLLAPVVERVAALLAASNDRLDYLPTPLTQSNRSAGRRVQRKRPPQKPHSKTKLRNNMSNVRVESPRFIAQGLRRLFDRTPQLRGHEWATASQRAAGIQRIVRRPPEEQ